MTILQIKIIFDAFIESCLKHGLIDPSTGNFKSFYASEAAAVAADIEAVLRANGVTVQENIDRVIQALPVVLPLFGVK